MIHKQILNPNDYGNAVIYVPTKSRFLSMQVQGNLPVVWYEVLDESWSVEHNEPLETEPWGYRFIVTGGRVPEDTKLEYVTTLQFHNGKLIYHVYKRL